MSTQQLSTAYGASTSCLVNKTIELCTY